MQKLIRIALPLAYIAVIIWYLFFGGFSYVDWKWLIGAAGIGAVCFVVLYVFLHKMLGKREEHLSQLAEEAVAPELETVKGNCLKKEMVKRRSVKEDIKRNSDDCSKEKIAIENIKGWLSSLKRCFYITCLITLALPILLIFAFAPGISDDVTTQNDYHNADDLRKVTGVEFPEIVPVDSVCLYGELGYEIRIEFVPTKPLDKDFFCRLDQACKTDSCCWEKQSVGYLYHIYPEAIPFDRTKGMHRRMVDVDGEKVPDWDGAFISVFVPIKGDTIILSDGWVL